MQPPKPESETGPFLPVVNSYNEWDPLEEVIVGRVDGSYVPMIDSVWASSIPQENAAAIYRSQARPYPKEAVEAAARELDLFAEVLASEGVCVRRPDPIHYGSPFSTPEWGCPNGFSAANPRDLLLVVGDEIIETPCAMRARYHEVNAYRSLLKEYFKAGARWTAAPKPMLTDSLFDPTYGQRESSARYPITEWEPTFDAADFVRCGRDLFVTQSVVTNRFGIEWLRRHLGPEFRIHDVQTLARGPMHIDTTLMPLAPGKVLVNPLYAPMLPDAFSRWDIIHAPLPTRSTSGDRLLAPSSSWLSMNVLSLDEERVFVDTEQESLIRLLRDCGFRPIPHALRALGTFGAGFLSSII